jgi:hypothetical protein
MDFDKKSELIKAASDGELVLFLGAGASVDCKMGDGTQNAPLGNALAQELAEHFFPDESYRNTSLKAVSTKVINLLGEGKLRTWLAGRLKVTSPSKAMDIVPLIRWSGIYSVNIDTAIETTYANQEARTQTLFPIVLPSDVGPSDKDTEVGYYNLNRADGSH